MKFLKYILLNFFLFLNIFLINSISNAQEIPPDEQGLFKEEDPDALLVLDLSGSMRWTPGGEVMYTNTAPSRSCPNRVDGESGRAYYDSPTGSYTHAWCIDPYGTVPKYSNSSCTGPFYTTAQTGYSTDCSRLAIAKRAIFDVLDDNDDNSIDQKDQDSLDIRFGYMRFYKCTSDDTGADYNSGCNKLIKPFGTKYSAIWDSIKDESAEDGTPLASALSEAKLYLDYDKSNDQYKNCRKKFVILITDGADTFACQGNGSENQSDQYKRRRATVAKAKELADAGYKVFVIGFGNPMPHWLRNTLNWAAYYGGTDNPLEANSGDTSAYDPTSIPDPCQSSTVAEHNIEGDGSHYYATSNDPGEIPLSGYAFLATTASQLNASIKQAIEMIRESTYSFSLASVSSQRTQDENHLYEASFQPRNSDPLWFGHLKKYSINSNGIVGNEVWDAGNVLQSTDPGNRVIKTLKNGTLTNFSTTNISPADLDVSTTSQRDAIVGFIRGESSYNPDYWKLGDIFHSNPVTIGTPSPFYEDLRDSNNAFATFRSTNVRTSANDLRIVLVGANDGQFHAFKTSNGSEAWSFIPPNVLPKLKNIAHSSHPTGLLHQYFVDGPVTVADVWLGTGSGTSKSASDWHTLLVLGLGRGGISTLWSSSSSCESGFSSTYSSSYPYYCGYYAFDVTNTINPVFKWIITPGSSLAPFLGQPWSKFAIGRVKINGNEKWVGFAGAGYNASDCKGGGTCDTRGKGFYVVDLSDGSILWSYTRANNSSMDYSFPGSPAIVDTDNDGFIDTAYIGDLGGSLWRFKFCTNAQGASCNTSNWSAGYLFQASTGEIRPIFGTPAVAKDVNGNLWIYWGTGDKTNPTAANAQEKFYALKDNDRNTTYGINDLDNITSGTYTETPNKHGWYINIAGSGEKILSDPAVFGGVVYFSTYTPHSSDKCDVGPAKLYGVNYTTGAGVLTTSGGSSGGGGSTTPVRSIEIGRGIPTSPVVSFKPLGAMPPDLYVTVSGGAGIGASTQRVNFDPPTLASRTNILYWKDRRLE